jgi:protein-disulfide isomerase
MKQKTLFIASAVVLVLVFVVGALAYKSYQTEQAAQAAKRNQPALTRFHAPTTGNADAKVHIVEFFDPACGTCAQFYPFVKNLMAINPGKIRLSVRYAPFHQGSDQVVRVLEAARKQGKFWQAMEAVITSQPLWTQDHVAYVDRVWKPLERVGLDLDRARSDMNAPEISRAIEQDLADAKTLNVTATPEFFVNGRPLPSFGFEQLKDLVDEELAKAYR